VRTAVWVYHYILITVTLGWVISFVFISICLGESLTDAVHQTGWNHTPILGPEITEGPEFCSLVWRWKTPVMPLTLFTATSTFFRTTGFRHNVAKSWLSVMHTQEAVKNKLLKLKQPRNDDRQQWFLILNFQHSLVIWKPVSVYNVLSLLFQVRSCYARPESALDRRQCLN